MQSDETYISASGLCEDCAVERVVAVVKASYMAATKARALHSAALARGEGNAPKESRRRGRPPGQAKGKGAS